jgi:hypothetical protein
MDDLPRSESHGHAEIDGRWILTHAVWRNSLGSYQPETGIRDLRDVDEKTERPRFDLIQHGWRDFQAAQSVIEKGLRKGWPVHRISDVMERLSRDRRR